MPDKQGCWNRYGADFGETNENAIICADAGTIDDIIDNVHDKDNRKESETYKQ